MWARTIAVFTLLLVACADSGTRDPTPNLWAGSIGVYWWAGATAQEQQWLTETANLHADLMAQHLGATPRVDVVFYKTEADLNAEATRIETTSKPNTYNLSRIRSSIVNNGPGVAFLHGGAVHIYAGPKLEGPELGHSLMHATIGEMPSTHVAPNINSTLTQRGGHQDPRWTNLLFDDWLLSLQIAGRR